MVVYFMFWGERWCQVVKLLRGNRKQGTLVRYVNIEISSIMEMITVSVMMMMMMI
jgi:hypothetical protein